ncbi:MAG: ArsA-related P-loop ATPase, partial [Myxococcota bacterium]
MFSRRIALITGKGGVGRTTVAAAWAVAAARAGKRVLVAEIAKPGEGKSSLGRLLSTEHLDADPQQVRANLWACQLWAARGHEMFLGTVLPSVLGRAALRSKAIRKFVDAVPSFYEMGLFYHLLTLLRARHHDGTYTYETVIVDMPATGHTLALTELPDVILRLVAKGPVARLLREGQSYLNDPEQTAA